jgi:hypothetical protein
MANKIKHTNKPKDTRAVFSADFRNAIAGMLRQRYAGQQRSFECCKQAITLIDLGNGVLSVIAIYRQPTMRNLSFVVQSPDKLSLSERPRLPAHATQKQR